jgi:hypothetical protein
MNHSSIKNQTVMVNNITSHYNMNHSSVKHQTVMVNNVTAEEWFILLWHVKLLTIIVCGLTGVVHIVVAVILLTITV